MADSKPSAFTDGNPPVDTDIVPLSRGATQRRVTVAQLRALYAATFAALTHSHAESDVTNLVSDLAAILAVANAHNTRHQDGGADEIVVTGLSGLLADAQTPLTENVQDIVGALIIDSSEIDATYNDGAGTLALALINNSIALARVVNIATARFLGRVTGGSGSPEELTGTQATTLLDIFTDTLKGMVPASGGGTTNYLRADGSFAAPPGTGGGDTYLYVSTQQDITAAGFVDITNLTFAVAANKAYAIMAHIIYQSSSTAMGVTFGVNGPASPARNAIMTRKMIIAPTTPGTDQMSTGMTAAYDTPLPNSVGEPSQVIDLVTEYSGTFLNGANAGTFALRFSKENVAGTASIMPGSWMKYKLLN